MTTQFIRIRSRLINVAAISYVRLYEDLDRIDIRLLGPTVDVTLTISVDREEFVPVREFFLTSGLVKDLRPSGILSPASDGLGEQPENSLQLERFGYPVVTPTAKLGVEEGYWDL